MIDYRTAKRSTGVKDARKAFADFAQDAVQTAEGLLELAADESAENIRDSIETGSLRVPKNNPSYAKQKRKEGFGGLPLVRTREYVEAIESSKIGPGMYKVGVRKGKHKSKMTYDHLGNMLEYGTGSKPPRPHFTPEFINVRERLRRAFQQQNAAALRWSKSSSRSSP